MNDLISHNPADNSVVGLVAISTDAEVAEKVSNAQHAKFAWRHLGVAKRIAILHLALVAFQKREHEICRLIMQEMGKPITECQEEVETGFIYFAAFLAEGHEYIKDEITVHEDKVLHRIVYEPRGVTACIVPWNFPFTNFIFSAIPNLIVGNPVVFKHSEECPLLGKLLEEVMASIKELPPGVFTEVYGGAQVGEALLAQPIDMVCFIGSSAIGKKIFALAGKKQIKAVLEMGGSNPSLVFADADLDQVIPLLYQTRFANCGQMCDATKRLIVHRSIHDTVVAKLVAYIGQQRIGDPSLGNTQLGPLAAMRQLELLEEQVADAVTQGATVVIGGARPKNLTGAYYLPTLLTHVTESMRVWREEVFGPVLSIMSFDSEEDAIALANNTIYGLGAVIYTKDLELARRVALQLDVGSVDINAGSHWRPENPFGGYKASGMGCSLGRWGFQELCLVKVVAEG